MDLFTRIKLTIRRWKGSVDSLLRKKDVEYVNSVFFPSDSSHCSVFCMNCFGGHIYQDLGIPYESPTAGLFFFADDFCSILEDICILKRKIEFVQKSKWELANQKMPYRKHIYPIGRFEGTDIEIHFLHYYTENDALLKWNRRMERFNFNHFIAIGFQQNECTKQTIERFERINIPNKVFFTNWDLQLPHAVFIPEFMSKESSPDPYKYVNIYYRYLVRFLKTNPLK